jgi:hypothetical protein
MVVGFVLQSRERIFSVGHYEFPIRLREFIAAL